MCVSVCVQCVVQTLVCLSCLHAPLQTRRVHWQAAALLPLPTPAHRTLLEALAAVRQCVTHSGTNYVACCLVQEKTSGSVSGGDIIDPVQQEPVLTLTRIGSGPLQTNVQFSLTAAYRVGGAAQAGVEIEGWSAQLQGCAGGNSHPQPVSGTVRACWRDGP